MAAPTLGTTLKEAREQARLTQLEVANALKVDRKTVDNWEHDRTVPRSSMAAIREFYASYGISIGNGGADAALPAIVRANRHIAQVMFLWSIPDQEMPELVRLALIRRYLELNPPAESHDV